jgi:enamidase
MRLRRVLIAVGSLVVLAVSAAAVYILTLYPAGPPQRGRLALVGATVLMGDDLEPVRDATVVVADGVITKAGPSGTVDIPPDARVIDVAGLTVMPGLIDLHVHLGSPALDARQEPGLLNLPRMLLDAIRFAPGHRRAALEHGVTTVRNLGDEHHWITDLRRQIDDRALEGPRLFVSGPMFTTAGGHPIVTFGADPNSDQVRVPSTPEEARSMVRELAVGHDRVDLIKVVQDRRPETGA